jgi:hypothetical protein
MPDLKTELKKLENLSFDDSDQAVEDSDQPKITTSQATFDYIRDNPGLTRAAIGHNVEKLGHLYTSAISLVSQLLNDQQIEQRGDKYYAIGTNYKPLPGGKRLKKKKATTRRLATRAANAAAKPVEVKTGFNANSIIKDLTIYQAKELRDALNNLFK